MKTNKSVTKKVASGAAGVALAATLYANAVYVPQNQEATRAELNAGVAAVLDGRADFVAKADGYQVVERSAEIEKLVDEIASLQGEVGQVDSQKVERAAYTSVVRTAQAGGSKEISYEEAIEGMSTQEAAAFNALTPAAKAQVATSANKSAALTTALQSPVNVVPAARAVFFNANNTPKPLATVSVAAIQQVAPAPVVPNTPVAVVTSTGSVAPVAESAPSAPTSGSPTGTTQGADIGNMANATANVFTSAEDVASAETGTGASTALNAQSNVGGGNSGGNPSQEAATGESSNAAAQIAVSGAADAVGEVAAAAPDTSTQAPTSP